MAGINGVRVAVLVELKIHLLMILPVDAKVEAVYQSIVEQDVVPLFCWVNHFQPRLAMFIPSLSGCSILVVVVQTCMSMSFSVIEKKADTA